MYKSLEYDGVLRQTERVADALREAGVPGVDVIENSIGEPVAVHLPGFFDPLTYQAGIPHSLAREDALGSHRSELRNSFPMVLDTILAPPILGLLDSVVQAATEEDVLATRVTQWDGIREHKDTGLHIDVSSFYPEATDRLPLSGMNLHLTSEGERQVQMGIVRHSGYLNIQDMTHDEVRAFYRENAVPFVEFSLHKGDGVIFQGGAHLRRRVLPIAHDFVTTSPQESRRTYDLFIPEVAPRELVIARRARLIQAHGLESMGYTALPSPVKRRTVR